LHQLSHSRPIRESIPCGSSGTLQVYPWWGLGGKFGSTESYFKTSDCQSVYLEVSSIIAWYVSGQTTWGLDQYAGQQYRGCLAYCIMHPGTTYYTTVDGWASPGYYYQTYVFNRSGHAYANIGPL
jgi:hypothetical protein